MRNPLLAALSPMGVTPRPRRQASYYNGASSGRLHMDWLMSAISADQVLKSDMVTLRTRARDLVMNNSSASRIPQIFSENVMGKDGILLQADVRHGGERNRDESLAIEDWWYRWSERGHCTVDGRYAFADVETLVAESEPTDGEVLIRMVDGFDNRFGFALELLDPDQLDASFNQVPSPGKPEIRMGIEVDEWNRPVAYHLWGNHPSELRKRTRIRVPADDIIHLYLSRRIGQSRGVTWFAPVVVDLQQLGGYREAHVIAARVGASQMGAIKNTDPQSSAVDPERAPGSPRDRVQMDAEPGLITELDYGQELQLFSPNFPDGNFDGFDKAMLRSIGTAMRVSYMSASGDLSATSYGSGRIGMLAERAVYQRLQQRVIDHVHRRVYRRGLRMAITAGVLQLDPFHFERYVAAQRWRPRSFPWIDPSKDLDAAEREIGLGITSRTALAAERGRDLEEVFQEIRAEQELAEKYGVTLTVPTKAAPAAPAPTDAPGPPGAPTRRHPDAEE